MLRQMKLVAFLITGPASCHHAMWRHPEAENRFLDPAFWESIARTLEVGRFDGIVFADLPCFHTEAAMAWGGQISLLDPIPLAAIMARATSHIGIGVTISTSLHEPHAIARLLSSLDVLSGGRLAWNIMASQSDWAESLDDDTFPSRHERYDRAEEVLKICLAMWKGWSDEALVVDKESGCFIDSTKIRQIEIAGKFVGARGTSTVPPSPQRRPVIMYAGSSTPRGRKFAATYAEIVFTVQHSLANMQKFYADMKDRVTKAGRNPEDCAILASVAPIVGETESIAREKRAYINALIEPRLAIPLVSAYTGLDFSQYPIDMQVGDILSEAAPHAHFEGVIQTAIVNNLTLGEVAKRVALGEPCLQVVGTPERVADQLQQLFEQECCDGFVVPPTQMPGSFEAFTRSVVPILQKRGLFRREYHGSTLRETMTT